MAKLTISSPNRDTEFNGVVGHVGMHSQIWAFAATHKADTLSYVLEDLQTGEVYEVHIASTVSGWAETFWAVLLKVEISDAEREGYKVITLVFEKQP